MERRRVAKILLLAAVSLGLLLAIGGYRFYRIVPALRSPAWELWWQLSVLLPLALAVAGAIVLRFAGKRPKSK